MLIDVLELLVATRELCKGHHLPQREAEDVRKVDLDPELKKALSAPLLA
jgi:hypothetical protein